MERREMLRMGTAAIALTLTGCVKKKTYVQFINGTNGAATVNATAGGLVFNPAKVQPGGFASQAYTPKAPVGTVVPLTGTIVLPGGTVPIVGKIIVGKINTFTLIGVATSAPPAVNVLVSVI